jgi:WD40 repeat protein/serine/threonine protein kinase
MQEQSIFIEALEKEDPAERAAFLDQVCAADPALRLRIERLLQRHQEPGRFMERPVPALVATVDEPPLTERPGTVIGPYKLLEQIGEGGFGVVFMAEQQQPLRRKVALKVLKPGMDTRQVVARFEAERQALALMDHPNIAHIFDGGETASGRPYFVMELVRGIPITDFCDHNQLAVRERLELYVSVCQAVQHAHQKGIIHRDLKPSNVLVTLHDDKAVVKVIDFGIAKATGQQLTEKTLFTNFGQMIGTPLYMSPEQAQLSGLDIDTRSDIYSLGVLLYELLTGTTPFDKERLRTAAYEEILRIIREEEPAKPSARISTLGQAATGVSANRQSDPKRLVHLCRGELDWIVMKALEKDRNRRYESASAFAADVQRYLQDEPVHACPPSSWYRLRKFARRNKRIAVLTAAAILLLLAATGVSSYFAIQADQRAQDAFAQKGRADASAKRADENAAKAQRLTAELALDKGQLLGEQGNANGALLWMARALKLAPADAGDLRAVIRRNLGAWSGRIFPLRAILRDKDRVFAVAFGPDGKTILTGTEDSTGQLWDTATREPIGERIGAPFMHSPTKDFSVAFSPDGSTMVAGGPDNTVRLWDVATRKLRWSRQIEGQMNFAAFSPQGGTVLIAWLKTKGGSAQLWDVATGKPRIPALEHDRPVCAAAFSPDGKTWVIEFGSWMDERGTGVAYFLDSHGHEIEPPLEHSPHALSLCLSPDGKMLLAACWDGKVWFWDRRTRQEGPPLTHGAPASALQFSPDGKMLLTGSFDQTARLWDLAGKPLSPPLRHEGLVFSVAISPDGKALLTGSGDHTARLWGVATASSLGPVLPHEQMFFPLAFSPDGRTILIRDPADRARLRLRDAMTGENVGEPLQNNCPFFGGAIGRDRKTVVTLGVDHRLRIWNATTGKPVANLNSGDLLEAVACSPDGRTVLTGSWKKAQVWDGTAGWHDRKEPDKMIEHPFEGPIFAVAFSPDGKSLLTGSANRAAQLWNAATGKPIGDPLNQPGGVFALGFSPDGKVVLTGGSDSTAQLWNTTTGKPLGPPLTHQGAVHAVAFSSDGKTALTGSDDKTARLWDTATGKPIGPPLLHPGPVRHVAFWHDGKTVLTAGEDPLTPAHRGRGLAQFWQLSTPVAGDAEQLELWAQIVTGMELEASGGMGPLDATTWLERRQKLKASGFEVP